MKEEFDRKPGLNPASWKYGVRWIDGPLQRERHQVFTVTQEACAPTCTSAPRS